MGVGWRPQSHEVHKHWLQTILDEAMDDLTVWEMKFIADMESLLSNGHTLTEGQERKLEAIYAEKTP